MLSDYYNRFQPENNWDSVRFRADRVLQSAELNEVQSILGSRQRNIGDAIFKDGDIIRDAQIVVNAHTGECLMESGAIYLAGAVRGVPPKSFTIATTGTVTVGVYLHERIVTEIEDRSLYNPAVGVRGEGEPGAARLVLEPQWGFAGDGQLGEFYPVYALDDGSLRIKETPPSLDTITQAVAAYDRDSAGGSYIICGMTLQALDDTAEGAQVYSLAEGRARVNGYGVELPQARRIVYTPVPDLMYIETEPHRADARPVQRILLERAPVKNITRIAFTHEKTVSLVHSYSGSKDLLPDTSVVELVEVKQNSSVYVTQADYKLTASQVDWSPTGNEPSPGTSYSVTYRYIRTFNLENAEDNVSDGLGFSDIDAVGVTIHGALENTQIVISYNTMLPRIDRLALLADGTHVWVQGIAASWQPKAPGIPEGSLPIASVYQTWTRARIIANDSVRVMQMSELNQLTDKIDTIVTMIALQQLEQNISIREAGYKKGYFVDPFLDDSQRDQGIPQTAAVVGTVLTLPIDANVSELPSDIERPSSLPYTLSPVLEQLSRSGSMKVNPYMAFEPVPAEVTLTPAVDRWTEVQTTWTSPITERLTNITGMGILKQRGETTTNQTVNTISSSRQNIERLRQIRVAFTLKGFDPKEQLSRLLFDGVDVTASVA